MHGVPHTVEHSKCEDLQLRLMEAKGNSDVLDVEREELLQKVVSLEEECQERCRLSNEWFESLKVCVHVELLYTFVILCTIRSAKTLCTRVGGVLASCRTPAHIFVYYNILYNESGVQRPSVQMLVVYSHHNVIYVCIRILYTP